MIILKLLSLLVVVVSSVFCIFGENRTNNRINKKGKILLVLTLVGFIISIAIEIYQLVKDREESELEQTWHLTENQSLFNLQLSIAFRENISTDLFFESLECFNLKLNTISSDGRYDITTFNIVNIDTLNTSSHNYRLVNKKRMRQNMDGSYLYFIAKCQKKDCNPASESIETDENIIPIGEMLDGKSPYMLTGITIPMESFDYVASRDSDFVTTKEFIHGFIANIPWSEINITKEIKTIKMLPDIGTFTFNFPSNINIELVDELSFSFQTASDMHFFIDLKSSNSHKSENSVSISGLKLYESLKENFNKMENKELPKVIK